MEKSTSVIFSAIDTMPVFFNPRQLANILGIGKNQAYRLALSKGFPSLRIGKRIIIHRDKFIDWLDANINS
jgi:hypothetical protein